MTSFKCTAVMAAAFLALAVTGCSGVKQSMGAGKAGPDETAIATRAPLVVPATFDLKPPQPGAPRPQDADTAAAAQRVLGGGMTTTAPASPGEQALLNASGANAADPSVRQELRNENRQTGQRKSYADSVLFWRGKTETGTPLDAEEEANRPYSPPPRPVRTTQPAPVIEKADDTPAAAKEPDAKIEEVEKKADGDEDDSDGWFDWF